MTTIWDNGDGLSDINGEDDMESFSEHVERMRRFRRSHGYIPVGSFQKCDELTFAEAIRAFCPADSNVEITESISLGSIAGLISLSLERKVMLSMN